MHESKCSAGGIEQCYGQFFTDKNRKLAKKPRAVKVITRMFYDLWDIPFSEGIDVTHYIQDTDRRDLQTLQVH